MKILSVEAKGPLASSDSVTIRMSRLDLQTCIDALKGYSSKTRGLTFDQVRQSVLTTQHFLDALKSEREARK